MYGRAGRVTAPSGGLRPAQSLFGLFVELGPMMLDAASLATAAYNASGVPSLFYNPYGWTQARPSCAQAACAH